MSLTLENIRNEYPDAHAFFEVLVPKNRISVVWGSFPFSSNDVSLEVYDPSKELKLVKLPKLQRLLSTHMIVNFNEVNINENNKIVLVLVDKSGVKNEPIQVLNNTESIKIPTKKIKKQTEFGKFTKRLKWLAGALQSRESDIETTEKKEVRKKYSESLPFLKPKTNLQKALTFDESDYVRSIGMIEIAIELNKKTQNSENKQLHQEYELFSGCGQGAIIACYLASGRDIEFLKNWWCNEWSQAINPTLFQSVIKAFHNTFTNTKPGFRRSKAIELIQDLFKDQITGVPLKLKDLQKEVYIPVMDANRYSFMYSRTSAPELTVAEAVIDSSLDPLYFQSQKTIESCSIFMGSVEKTPNLLLLHRNPDLAITSIGAPVRYYEHGDISGASRDILALIQRDKSHALHLMHCEEIAKKHPGQYIRYECRGDIMDGAKQQSTRDDAIAKSIESGKGVVKDVDDGKKINDRYDYEFLVEQALPANDSLLLDSHQNNSK